MKENKQTYIIIGCILIIFAGYLYDASHQIVIALPIALVAVGIISLIISIFEN